MNKMQKNGFGVMFIIFLILCLPIYSSVVLASFSYDYGEINAYGDDNINGFLKGSDTLYVKVEDVKIGDRTLIGSNVVYKVGASPWPFSICEDSDGDSDYDCVFEGSYFDRTAQAYSFKISFYNGSEYSADTPIQKYHVDAEAPSISFTSISPDSRGMKLKYTVTENSGGTSYCSGIKDITVKGKVQGGELVVLNTTNLDVDCVAPTLIHDVAPHIIPITDIREKISEITSDGEYDLELCIEAVDKLGQESDSVCKEISNYDLIKPSIDGVSFLISGSAGTIPNNADVYVRNNGQIYVSVNVTGEDSAVTAVADLSHFNPSADTTYLSCSPVDDVNVCETTSPVTVIGVETGPALVPLNVTDDSGNTATLTKEFNVKIDEDEPIVDSIHSAAMYNTTSYIKKDNNVIIAIINETGSCFRMQKPKLSSVNLDYDIIADTCSPSPVSTQWKCEWNNINLTSSVISDATEIKFSLAGTDDAGNAIDNSKCTKCSSRSDVNAPLNPSINVNNGIPISVGSPLGINLSFSETYSGFAGVSSAYAATAGNCGLNKAADSCSEERLGMDLWCYWQGNVNDNTCMNENINFTIKDVAGNYDLYIATLSDTGIPNVVELTTEYNGWLGKETTVIARINETGSGINKQNVELKTNSQNIKYNGAPVNMLEAHYCTQTENMFECSWENITCVDCEAVDSINLQLHAEDNAGNNINPYTTSLDVDVAEPEVENILIQEISEYRTSDQYIKAGDIIDIIITLNDTKSKTMTAFLNASEIGAADNIAGICVNISSTQLKCTWEKDEGQTIDIPESIFGLEKKLRFSFTDHTENTLDYEKLFDVLEPGEIEDKFYRFSVIKNTPEKISRRTLVNSDQTPIFYSIRFNKNNPDHENEISIQRKKLECTSKYLSLRMSEGDSHGGVFMLGNIPSASDPVQDNIMMQLGFEDYSPGSAIPPELDVENFDVSCIATLNVKQEENIYTEKHNMTLKVPLYRSPVDDAPKKILEKLQKEKKYNSDGWQLIGKLDRWMTIARKTCTSFGVFTRIYSSLQYLKGPIYGISQLAGQPGIWTGYAKIVNYAEKIKSKTWSPWEYLDDKILKNSDEFVPDLIKPIAGGKDKKLGIFHRICAFSTCSQCFDKNYEGLGFQALQDFRNAQSETATKIDDYTTSAFGDLGEFSLFGDPTDPNKAHPYFYSSLSPDKSMITAVSCLCIPAILTHVQRWRQIHCDYIDCMKDTVTSSFFAPKVCEMKKEKLECLYVTGAFWNIIPFMDIVQKAQLWLESIIANAPARLMTYLRSSLCEAVDKFGIDEKKGGLIEDITIKGFAEDGVSSEALLDPWQSIVCGALDAALVSVEFDEEVTQKIKEADTFWGYISATIEGFAPWTWNWNWENLQNSVLGDKNTWVTWSQPWKISEEEDLCMGIFCEEDEDCTEPEKCYDDLCFNLGDAEVLVNE